MKIVNHYNRSSHIRIKKSKSTRYVAPSNLSSIKCFEFHWYHWRFHSRVCVSIRDCPSVLLRYRPIPRIMNSCSAKTPKIISLYLGESPPMAWRANVHSRKAYIECYSRPVHRLAFQMRRSLWAGAARFFLLFRKFNGFLVGLISIDLPYNLHRST